MSNLNFTFTIDKLNIILAGLGEVAAKRSATVITKIQDEAKSQIEPVDNQVDPKQELKFELTLEETNLLLEGLGELPARVSMQLIEEIKTDAQSQLKSQTAKSSEVEMVKPEPKTETQAEEKSTEISFSKSDSSENSHHIPVSNHQD